VAYDQEIAGRIRDLLAGEDRLSEQPMFGGLAFLVNGNMAVAVSGQGGLLVRVDPDEAEAWIDDERVTPMVMRGREMRGWLRVATEPADPTGRKLELWVSRGFRYARTLPPKKK